MSVFDIFDFATMEQFILENHYVLNCFDDQELQEKALSFREKELFFLVNNSWFSGNLDSLLSQYWKEVDGKFSYHQSPQVAVCNDSGDFWVKTNAFSHYAKDFSESRNPIWIPVYDTVYQKFDDVFREDIDYQILYEDEFVKIIVFLLQVKRVFTDEYGMRHFHQNGYYVNSQHICDILPYDQPYDYYYHLLGYDFLQEHLSSEDFMKLKNFYSSKKRELKK